MYLLYKLYFCLLDSTSFYAQLFFCLIIEEEKTIEEEEMIIIHEEAKHWSFPRLLLWQLRHIKIKRLVCTYCIYFFLFLCRCWNLKSLLLILMPVHSETMQLTCKYVLISCCSNNIIGTVLKHFMGLHLLILILLVLQLHLLVRLINKCNHVTTIFISLSISFHTTPYADAFLILLTYLPILVSTHAPLHIRLKCHLQQLKRHFQRLLWKLI